MDEGMTTGLNYTPQNELSISKQGSSMSRIDNAARKEMRNLGLAMDEYPLEMTGLER